MSDNREPIVNWTRLLVLLGGAVIIYFAGVGFRETFFQSSAKSKIQWAKDGNVWRDPVSGITVKEITP